MPEKSAKILLASVILARSSSYILAKIGLNEMGVFNLMGIRFLMAFAIMFLLFRKHLMTADKKSITAGFAVGAAYFIVMSFEVFSLKTCESSTTAFLENTAIVMVPLFEAFLARKMLPVKTVVSFLMAMSGVALMTLQGTAFSFTFGHFLALIAAVTYAGAILITDRLSKQSDALVIGIVQLGTMGGLSAIASFLFEQPRLPSEASAWIALILLACVCSCFGFTLQPVAQKYTSAETAGLYCAFGPLGAGALGWLCLNEALSAFAFIGAGLILLSILITQKK